MIVIADEMEDAMDDYAVKLIVELGSVEDGILTDGINADEKVSGNPVALAIVESDNVREIIVA